MNTQTAYELLQYVLLEPISKCFDFLTEIGTQTCFIHLEDSLDLQIQPIADSLGMQLGLIKVSIVILFLKIA